MRRTEWSMVVAALAAGLGAGCLVEPLEGDQAALGINWDCQSGTPEQIATCKHDASKRYPGQTRFESAASWRHMWRDTLLESARSSEASQVIEESDIFRVDGDTLYVLNPYRGLFVMDITNVDAPRIMAREAVFGSPTEMYVRGGNAYILFNDYYRWNRGEEARQGAQVLVVNIALSNQGGHRSARTQVVGQYGLDGWLLDSRLVYEDGGEHRARLYVMSTDTRYYGNWWDEDDSNGQIVNNTHILSLNVTDPSHIVEADRMRIDGAGHVIQATTDYIFVASQDWASRKSEIRVVNIQDRDGRLAEAATVQVEGYIRHKFNMDFRNGRLRVVSHDWNWDPENGSSGDVHVTTYDATNMMTKGDQLDLVGVGSLEATRFAEDRVYLVHVQRIDPIEIVDLSNPAHLTSLGELEIPGWLEHLEIRGETVLGVGYDQGNTTVPARRCDGYTLDGQALAADATFPELPGNSQKLSVSAYDVGDPAALCEVSRTRFGAGDWPYADLEDDKTLRLLDTNADGVEDMFLIPWESWTDESENDDDSEDDSSGSINAVTLVDVSLGSETAPAQVRARGQIQSVGSIQRSFPARGRVMVLGNEELIVTDLSDRDHPAVTARVEMARNVQAFAVAGQYGVQLINDWDAPAAELRVLPIADPDGEKSQALSNIELRDEAGNKLEAEELYTNDNIVTVVGREWKYDQYDDNNDGTTDRWEYRFEVRFTNYQIDAQGRITLGGTLLMPLATDGGFSAKFANLKDIIRLGPSMFVVSAPDGLFRAVSTASAAPAITHVEPAPYGAYGIEDLRVYGSQVYAVTYQPVVTQVEEAQDVIDLGRRNETRSPTKAIAQWRPRAQRVAYYVTRVTLDAQGQPTSALYRVNVPGRLIDVRKDGDHETWTTLDSRWVVNGEEFKQEHAMFTVDASALHATLLDGINVGQGVEDVRILGDEGVGRTAFLVDNNSWSGPIVPLNADGTPAEEERKPHLILIDLSDPSAITEAARVELPGYYAYLREVSQVGGERFAFVSLGWGGGLGVIDATRANAPEVVQFTRSNGGVWNILVNANRREAYFAAGMYGVQHVALPAPGAQGAAN